MEEVRGTHPRTGRDSSWLILRPEMATLQDTPLRTPEDRHIPARHAFVEGVGVVWWRWLSRHGNAAFPRPSQLHDTMVQLVVARKCRAPVATTTTRASLLGAPGECTAHAWRASPPRRSAASVSVLHSAGEGCMPTGRGESCGALAEAADISMAGGTPAH